MFLPWTIYYISHLQHTQISFLCKEIWPSFSAVCVCVCLLGEGGTARYVSGTNTIHNSSLGLYVIFAERRAFNSQSSSYRAVVHWELLLGIFFYLQGAWHSPYSRHTLTSRPILRALAMYSWFCIIHNCLIYAVSGQNITNWSMEQKWIKMIWKLQLLKRRMVNFFFLFRSPCQRQCELLPSLGVRRMSSVNFSHFNLLLWNPSAKWSETW